MSSLPDRDGKEGMIEWTPAGGTIPVRRIRTPGGEHRNADFPLVLVGVHAGRPVEMLQERHGERRRRRFVFGDAFIVPANATLLCEHTRSTDDIYLGVPPDLLASGAADLGETFHTPEALADFGGPDAVLQHIAFALLRERAAPGLGATLYAQALHDQLVIHLLRRYARRVGQSVTLPESPPTLSPARLHRSLAYINDNLGSPLLLRDIAGAAGLSPHHFGRLFKAATGLSPHQYVLRRRLELARDLLLRTRLPVAEIALHAGFYDQSHLSRHFKRRYGIPPTTLRNPR